MISVRFSYANLSGRQYLSRHPQRDASLFKIGKDLFVFQSFGIFRLISHSIISYIRIGYHDDNVSYVVTDTCIFICHSIFVKHAEVAERDCMFQCKVNVFSGFLPIIVIDCIKQPVCQDRQ